MSEAVEWRVARLKILLSYFFAMFVLILGGVFLVAGFSIGGAFGAFYVLYGVAFASLSAWITLFNYGLRSTGYVRSFVDRVPKIGGYDQRALDEWGDELEERDVFHGDRE